jgi:hypothetical protein
MTCEEFQDRISDYLDGLLPPGEAAAYGAHRLGCEACRDLLADVGGALAAVHELPEVEPPLQLLSRALVIPALNPPLDCARVESLVTEFLDGYLEPSQYHAIEDHFGVCEGCSDVLAGVVLAAEALERPLDIALADFEGRAPDAQLEFLHARLVQARLLPPSPPSVMRGPVATFETAIRTPYAPNRTFDGDVKLVMVPAYGEDSSATEQRIQRETEAWRRLTPNLRVLRGTGNHMTLLSSPYVQAAAAWAFQHSNRAVQSLATSTVTSARL